MSTRPSWIGWALAAACLQFVAPAALACSCMGMSVREAKKSADIVFAGKVESVTAIDSLEDTEPRLVVRFRVARVWKGPVTESFEMHTSYNFSSCGGFPRGYLSGNQTLLVYGYGGPASDWKAYVPYPEPDAAAPPPGDLSSQAREELLNALSDQRTVYTTGYCTRTMPVEYAVEDFKKLGKATELAPLEVVPDPVLVEATRYLSNNTGFACGALDNARIWTTLRKPPPEAPALVAYLENHPIYSSIPRPLPLKYKEYWFTAADGRIGYCRTPKRKDVVCGRADVEFTPDPPGSGKWKIDNGGVSTYCKQFIKQPEPDLAPGSAPPPVSGTQP